MPNYNERIPIYDRVMEINGRLIQSVVALEELSECQKEICKIINESANYSENAKVIMLHLLSLATGQSYEDLEVRFRKNQQQQ